MKKVLALLVVIGLLLSSGYGVAVSASGSNYDDIPWEYVSIPVQ